MKVNLVVSFLVLAMIIASCVTPLIDLSLKYDLATETAAAANQNNRFSREQCGLATGGSEASPSSKPPPPTCTNWKSQSQCIDNNKNNPFILVATPTKTEFPADEFTGTGGAAWMTTTPADVDIKCTGGGTTDAVAATFNCRLVTPSATLLDTENMICSITSGGGTNQRNAYSQDNFNGCWFNNGDAIDVNLLDTVEFNMELATGVANLANTPPPGDCQWFETVVRHPNEAALSLWADIQINFNGISLKEPEPPVAFQKVNADGMLKCSGDDCVSIFGAKYEGIPLSEYFLSEPTEMSCDVFKVRTPTLKAWMGWGETFDGAADGGRTLDGTADLDNMDKTAHSRVEWCHATVGFVSTAVGLMSVLVLLTFFMSCFGTTEEEMKYEVIITTAIWFFTGICLLSAASWTASMVDADGSDGGFEPGPNQHVDYGVIAPEINAGEDSITFYVNGNTGAGAGLITMFIAAMISFIMAGWHAGKKLQGDGSLIASRGVIQCFMAVILLMGVVAMSTDLFTETYSFNGGDTALGSCVYVQPADLEIDKTQLNKNFNICKIKNADKATCESTPNTADCKWSPGNYEYSFDMSIWRVNEKSNIPTDLTPADIFLGNTVFNMAEVSDKLRADVDTNDKWIPWEMHGFIDSCDPAKSKTFWSSSQTATAMCRVNKATSIMLIIVPIIVLVMMSFAAENTARVIMSVLVSVLLLFVTMTVGLTASVYDNYINDGGANSLETPSFSEKSLDASFVCLCIAMILILLAEVMLLALSCDYQNQKNERYPGPRYTTNFLGG